MCLDWLYVPFPSPSPLTPRWRAVKLVSSGPACSCSTAQPLSVCVLQTVIGLSKGQHNAGQLKGSHFCSLLSVSLYHTFSNGKKNNLAHTSEHAVALTKWLITPRCTLPSTSLDSSSSQPPLKMAGTSWRLSSLSPFLCSDLETEMKEWWCSHNCCNTVPPPLEEKKNTQQQDGSHLHRQLEEEEEKTFCISASIKIGLRCLSLVLFISH